MIKYTDLLYEGKISRKINNRNNRLTGHTYVHDYEKDEMLRVGESGVVNRRIDNLYPDVKTIYELFLTLFYREDSNVDCYFFKDQETAEKQGFYRTSNGLFCNKGTKSNKPAIFAECDVSRYLNEIYSKQDLGRLSPTYLVSEGKSYTFGVEIETDKGYLPLQSYFKERLSLECIRDGSLRNENGDEEGGEYVTGVLQGDLGFFNLKKSLSEISKHCTIDKKCGIHVHVGGCKFDSQFAVLAYILALRIEDEVFATTPPSRRENNMCGKLIKQDYLDIIRRYNLEYGSELCYHDLFEKVGNGRKLTNNLTKNNSHPGGRYTDRYSRGIDPKDLYRYKWLNFVPVLFNMKGTPHNPVHTIEFRNHPASLNYEKIKNWILFCFAFVSYVENNKYDIINKETITIADILNASYKKNNKELVEYFENRKILFAEDGDKQERNEYKQRTIGKVDNIKKALNV